MASALVASRTVLVSNPSPSLKALNRQSSSDISNRDAISLLLPPKPFTLFISKLNRHSISPISKSRTFVCSSTSFTTIPNHPSTNPRTLTHSFLADSARTITTVFAVAFSLSATIIKVIRSFALKIKGLCIAPSPDELATIQAFQENLVCTVGPMFFASLRDRPSGYLNTPLTVVAAGLAKWLDIYSGVLMVRVLLSWFPNIPWERQPLSAIRDLCDPYLNLFRNIIPPVFDTLDVSPLLAFGVLGVLGSILNSSRRTY